MIIGILGKGGSGKSTIATNLARFLAARPENKVLAIDADHNMDLTYNLGVTDVFPYLGHSLPDLKAISGLNSTDDYRLALANNKPGLFTLSPADNFTKKYTKQVTPNLSLMTAGPQTDDVLADRACSHILFTSLKVYLPLLSLQEDEWVVVDEKAGADGVSTGIPTGFDVALIVSEPTIHGLKTAKQIAGLLAHYGVPYEFVINKAVDHHAETDFTQELGQAPIAIIGFDQSFSTFDGSHSEAIINYFRAKQESLAGQRYERSKKKFNHQAQ